MADKQNSEKLATQSSTNLGINNNYGPSKNIHYVQWCVSEMQGDEKVAIELSLVIYDKYGACLLFRLFSIKYKFSLLYKIQPCELHKNRLGH